MILCFHPVSAVDDGRRFVPSAKGEPFILAQARIPEDRTENPARGSGENAELLFDFLAQFPNLRRYRAVGGLKPVLHCPEDSCIGVPQ